MTELTTEQMDVCAGIGILYMGPKGTEDEYTHGLVAVMESGDVDAAQYVSASMVRRVALRVSEETLELVSRQWVTAFNVRAAQ